MLQNTVKMANTTASDNVSKHSNKPKILLHNIYYTLFSKGNIKSARMVIILNS